MICARCKVDKLKRMKILGNKIYCKHCYGAVTRGILSITDY